MTVKPTVRDMAKLCELVPNTPQFGETLLQTLLRRAEIIPLVNRQPMKGKTLT